MVTATSAGRLGGSASRPSRRCRRPGVVGALTALTVVVVGCGGISQQSVGDDDVRFMVHGRTLGGSSDAMAAEVTGLLTAADGCVLLDRDGDRFPVVWPRGTSVEATDPLVIRMPSGEELRAGDRVRGGGGYLSADILDVDVPQRCLGEHGEVAVFNPDDDPTVAATWVASTSAPALQCPQGVVESSVYDYGDSPPPDGPQPLDAVEAFVGDGVPDDARLELEGLGVEVIMEVRTVATIGLRTVPGGYVVESIDACQGAIRTP